VALPGDEDRASIITRAQQQWRSHRQRQSAAGAMVWVYILARASTEESADRHRSRFDCRM
jgi:hypothetical protein